MDYNTTRNLLGHPASFFLFLNDYQIAHIYSAIINIMFNILIIVFYFIVLNPALSHDAIRHSHWHGDPKYILKPKPLKNFRSKHKTNKQRENNYELVENFLKDPSNLCNRLYPDKEGVLLERCYYAYSPINKYEFFIMVLSPNAFNSYCAEDPLKVIYRVPENHQGKLEKQYSRSGLRNEGGGSFAYLIGKCDKGYFENSIYTYGGDEQYSSGASSPLPCNKRMVINTKEGDDYIKYEWSQCDYNKNLNKIDVTGDCEMYWFENSIPPDADCQD